MAPRPAAKASASEAALLGAEIVVDPARPRAAVSAMGAAGSANTLARLNAAVAELKAISIQGLLQQAVEALGAERPKAAAEAALKALEQDERNGHAWYVLAVAREKVGDFKGSLQCYEAALQLLPQEAEVANDLGRLAYRLDMKPLAEKLFIRYLEHQPTSIEAANNLACALRDQNRYVEAIDVLKTAIGGNPAVAQLWNTLGTVLSEQGEFETAVTFFDEAMRCDPKMFRARYNRGNARLSIGDGAGADEDNAAALRVVKAPDEAAMMRLARSTILLVNGEVGAGWDAYEARLEPQYADVTHFMIDRPQWTPQSDLEGRSLLLMGEQGLGDEVLFANMIPDVLEALGPKGRLHLAVEKRLVPLMQRSFPDATVGAHATYRVDTHTVRGAPFVKDFGAIDLWAPLASPLRRFRRTVDAYPDRQAFLVPDPERVAHWRRILDQAPACPKVGLLWKSLKVDGSRQRYFSPFEQWAPVLATPGAAFVNLQYGDCAAEIAEARATLGVDIWEPPGIDLKDDLDDVAALSSALDLVIGPANATSNIAAACGAPVWLVSMPAAWPRLGTDRYPWYPSVTVFKTPGFNQWGPVMNDMAQALERFVTGPATMAAGAA